MPTETAQRVLRLVQQTLPSSVKLARPLEPSTPLFSSRLFDSMGMIELLIFLEREFDVSLDLTTEELVKLDTAEHLAERIDRLTQARPRA